MAEIHDSRARYDPSGGVTSTEQVFAVIDLAADVVAGMVGRQPFATSTARNQAQPAKQIVVAVPSV